MTIVVISIGMKRSIIAHVRSWKNNNNSHHSSQAVSEYRAGPVSLIVDCQGVSKNNVKHIIIVIGGEENYIRVRGCSIIQDENRV